MKRKTLFWLVPLTLFMVTAASCGGCAFWSGGGVPSETWGILDQAEDWEVYSLFPDEREKRLPERFQSWPVLGKTEVRDPETRRRLREALAAGTRWYQQWGPGASCFNPRHGIHASYGGKSVDLVICFECGYIVQNKRMEFRTTAAAQTVFDAVLTDAGVSLAFSGAPPWALPEMPIGKEQDSLQPK